MMRICIMTPRYPPDRCGVGDYTARLAEHLAQRGVQVTIMTSRALHERVSARLGNSIRIHPLIRRWSWGALPPLCSAIIKGRYDAIHIQYQNEMYERSAAITALPLVVRILRPRLPVVVTVHDYGTPWPRRMRLRAVAGPYGKIWFWLMLLAAWRVILTNEQDRWRFLKQRLRYPVPPSRYTLVPVGSNLPPITDGQTRTRDGEIRIGYFGFVNPAKGVDTLLDGFALARQACPALHLTMICRLRSDDPYQRAIMRRLDDPSLQRSVTVTGELDDRAASTALAECDIVVLPFRDGISLKRTTLMAALALGRPIISTRSPIPAEALRDGEGVILVPPDDAPELARAMLDLACHPDLRIALSARARAAAERFAWPAIAARIERIYREVLA